LTGLGVALYGKLSDIDGGLTLQAQSADGVRLDDHGHAGLAQQRWRHDAALRPIIDIARRESME
jgi:hypothetical protein